MAVFLSLKQIVDMLYQFKFLDIIMLAFATFLVGWKAYKLIKEPGFSLVKIKECLVPSDVLVVVLGLLFSIALIKNFGGLTNYIKIASALFIYFLGRLYGSEIYKHGRKLAIVSYIIIYINAVYFFYHLISYIVGDELFFANVNDIRNVSFLYFYKTDMAIAILLGAVFIYCFGKVRWLKGLTLFVVGPFFLFNTAARTGQALYFVLLCLILINEIRKKISQKKAKDMNIPWHSSTGHCVKLVFGLLLVATIVLMLLLKITLIKEVPYTELPLSQEQFDWLAGKFHEREIMWWDTLHYIAGASPLAFLIGTDVDTMSFATKNSAGLMSHSVYLTLIYSTGFIGFIVFLVFLYNLFMNITKCNSSMTRFVVISIWLLFLFYGFSVETLESTQFSWFPFLFAGALFTENKQEK